MVFKFSLSGIAATKKIASAIAAIIVPNFVITLSGNLGAGKTTLTREILLALGVQGTIKSPTFTLVEPYIVKDVAINHFDLYRFNDPEEWLDAGFDEYFLKEHLCFIEWPEKAHNLIPSIDWEIILGVVDENQRTLTITALTKIGEKCLKSLIATAEI